MTSVNAGIWLTAGLARTDLDEWRLWVEYFALGGSHPYRDLCAYIAGEQRWSALEHDLAVQALNENLADQGFGCPVRYSADLNCRNDDPLWP